MEEPSTCSNPFSSPVHWLYRAKMIPFPSEKPGYAPHLIKVQFFQFDSCKYSLFCCDFMILFSIENKCKIVYSTQIIKIHEGQVTLCTVWKAFWFHVVFKKKLHSQEPITPVTMLKQNTYKLVLSNLVCVQNLL